MACKPDSDEYSDEELATYTRDLSLNDVREFQVQLGEKFTLTIPTKEKRPEIVVKCKAEIIGGQYYIKVKDSHILVHGYLHDVMNCTMKIEAVPWPIGWSSTRIHGTGERNFYNYLLFDPTKLPCSTVYITFKKFVKAIFYVGKATHKYTKSGRWYRTQQRSYYHFYMYEDQESQSMIDRSKAIRYSKEAIIVAHFFDCDSKDDALTKEACMIRAIGKDRLVNKHDGFVKDETLLDDQHAQICLGVHCLYLTFNMYEGAYKFEYPGPSMGKSRSQSAPPD